MDRERDENVPRDSCEEVLKRDVSDVYGIVETVESEDRTAQIPQSCEPTSGRVTERSHITKSRACATEAADGNIRFPRGTSGHYRELQTILNTANNPRVTLKDWLIYLMELFHGLLETSFLFRFLVLAFFVALAGGMIALSNCEWMPQGRYSLGPALPWVGLMTFLSSGFILLDDEYLRALAWRIPAVVCVLSLLRVFWEWIMLLLSCVDGA